MWSTPGRVAGFRGVEQIDKHLHINILELEAAFLAFHESQDQVMGYSVVLLSDNTTVVAYVNKQGGTGVPSAQQVNGAGACVGSSTLGAAVSQIHSKQEGRSGIQAQLPGSGDRDRVPSHPDIRLFDLWGLPVIGLFTTQHNRNFPEFSSIVPNPQAAVEDTFQYPWELFLGQLAGVPPSQHRVPPPPGFAVTSTTQPFPLMMVTSSDPHLMVPAPAAPVVSGVQAVVVAPPALAAPSVPVAALVLNVPAAQAAPATPVALAAPATVFDVSITWAASAAPAVVGAPATVFDVSTTWATSAAPVALAAPAAVFDVSITWAASAAPVVVVPCYCV
ncbi:BCL-6 corepressor-like protein 1 [Macrobrachium rosenbergii]|uniref:BCL-6 corepressor-like protein 1 n=1 Tax=Macrobrachium rosenbergii TaxID=79674 RepID=UPI0034D4EDEF